MSGGLSVRGLDAGYGSVPVVRSFDMEAEPGSVVALLGPNGAGKTTLMTTVAGLLPALGGRITVGGQTLRSGRPADANRAGVVLVPDDRSLFPGLSVAENLESARRKGGPRPRDLITTFPALESRWGVPAGALSGGEQQMLAVARGLVQSPTVLLIDEMSMGLAPVVVESLLPVVRRIADSTGAVVVLVEQHVELALDVADQAVVLVHGAVSLRGTAADVKSDRGRLEAAYLGAAAPPDPTTGTVGPPSGPEERRD